MTLPDPPPDERADRARSTRRRKRPKRHRPVRVARSQALEMVFGFGPTILPASILSCGTLTWIAWRPGLESSLIAWLLAIAVVTVLRLVDWWSYSRAPRPLSAARAQRFVTGMTAGTLASSMLWALFPLLTFEAMPDEPRAAATVVLAALASASAMVLGPMPRLAALSTGSLLLPASLMLILSGAYGPTLGALGFVYYFAVLLWLSRTHRTLVDAFEISRLNRKLMVSAWAQRQRMAQMNAELTAAQSDLMEMNHQLEHRVKQRTAMLEREIHERQSYQSQLERLASHDSLTGLANRAQLSRRLTLAVESAATSGARIAVLFIDLDRFKEINDGLGHAVGDKVLNVIGHRLALHAPDALCIARWGGDEFVMVRSMDDPIALEKSARAMVASLGEPIAVGSSTVRVGASVGVAIYPDHGQDPDTLIRRADMAVYEAKLGGRGQAMVFRPEWQVRASERHELLQELKRAIREDTLELVYQPVVHAADLSPVAVEALLRWCHPTLGMISPAVFVPLAEEAGMMVELGRWVLANACRDACTLIGPDCARVAINVSVHQFAQGDFLQTLDEELAASGVAPDALELELTESVYARDPSQVLAVLQGVRSRGLRIAIDDFGTGYSSLAYLQRFPVDVLKVDRSFVRDLDRGGDTIIRAVTSLAGSLDMRVVAEGVETPHQLERIRALGAFYVQGYLIAHPMPREQASAWLREHGARSTVATPRIAEPAAARVDFTPI